MAYLLETGCEDYRYAGKETGKRSNRHCFGELRKDCLIFRRISWRQFSADIPGAIGKSAARPALPASDV
jgi:hypothetical protein